MQMFGRRWRVAPVVVLVVGAVGCVESPGAPPADAAPPVLDAPDRIVVPNSGAEGTLVEFAVGAVDYVDGVVPVTCVPSSGERFDVGTTTVRCDAADSSGNVGEVAFAVEVTAPLFDDFEEGVDTSGIWGTVSPSVLPRDGRIELTTSAATTTRCQLAGDYDASVEYAILGGWDAPTRGVTAGLMTNGSGGVQRSKYDTNESGWYLNHFPPSGPSHKLATEHTQGSLRMERRGSTMRTYFKDDEGRWVLLGAAVNRPTTPHSLVLNVWYNTGYYNNRPFTVAFDNFVVYSVDGLVCP